MMLKNGFSLVSGLLILVSVTGCASMPEMQTIEQFAQAMEKEDIKSLKHHTTMKFSKVALRDKSSLDDLKVLKIPTGEATIVEIKDVSENHKKVVVEVGKNKKKLLYELKKVTKTGEWVVDDIYINQKHKNLNVMKSVSEQMDLLLTIREFVDAWENGNRDDILASTDGEFKETLDQLQPAFLAKLAKRVSGNSSKSKWKKPDAQLDKNIAIIRLDRRSGQMIITMKLTDGKWKATDVAVESRVDKQHVKSAKKEARMLLAVSNFLDAYNQNDKVALKKYSADKFYQGSLNFGDLKVAPLPDSNVAAADYELKTEGDLANFITQNNGKMVNLSILKIESDEMDVPDQYLIEEVTLFKDHGNQQITLTSLFSSRAITLLFNEALTKHDIKILGFSSTPDLSTRVWDKVSPNLVAQLPVDDIAQPGFEILDIDFNGSVTKVHARQGNLPLTYILRDHLGQLLVDDIELDLQGRPASVKATLELLVQVQNYAYDMHENNIRNLQRHSSRDFNELVWRQVDRVPKTVYPIPELLMSELTSMELNENQGLARIKLGDDQRGATVLIKKQHDEYVVDDIMIHSDKVASRYVSSKKELRLSMAANSGILRQNAAYQATYTISSDTKPEEITPISIPEVEPAAFEVPQQEP
ncbi:hypothetical protein Enr10x_18770 [Gimesia panareensis]|uniref:Uncharacterized protein n=2 Tax=Gimesia panareensis TaxID=2527978 RepID=A0A517Q4K5_9PLAN|nr:hypothetical protein Enr10x_18770 [Gimesia panareensis]QDU50548.1 hypothetical protein Pan110_29000 [Gimesia panareensis]